MPHCENAEKMRLPGADPLHYFRRNQLLQTSHVLFAQLPPRTSLDRRGVLPGTFAVMVLAAACSLTSCGKRDFPRPPQLVRPKAIQDLRAHPVADGIRLTWTRPTTTAEGRAMPDLDGFMISRAVEAPMINRPEELIFEHIATIHLDDRARFDQVRKMTFDDRDVVAGHVYVYRVTAFTLDRYFSIPSPGARARWSGPSPATKPDE